MDTFALLHVVQQLIHGFPALIQRASSIGIIHDDIDAIEVSRAGAIRVCLIGCSSPCPLPATCACKVLICYTTVANH